MKKPTRILIVEDVAADAELAQHAIGKVLEACEFQVVETRKDFLKALKSFQPDVILTDYALPSFDGMTALKLTRKHAPLTPVIIWTGSLSEDVAVECMKAGANNYVIKDNLKRLGPSLLRALEDKQLLIQHKQAEEKLKERERQLTILFSNLPGPVYRCRNDVDHTMEFISDGIMELSGYPAEDFSGHRRDFGELIHPDDRERIWAEIQTAVEQNQSFELTYRIITANGKQKWVWEKGQGIREENGQLQALEGFITDITERKQAEEALQDSEKRFRVLTENGLDSIALLSVDGTLLWESPSSLRTLNYALNQHIGCNIFVELMHPNDQKWVRDVFAQIVQQPGHRQHGTFRLRHADGSWHWVEAIVTNMLHEPSINAIVANYRDVNEQKEAEKALRDNQIKYQNLVETSHDLIWSVDAEGRITFLNQAAREIYGYEPEELIGRSFFEIMDPEHYHQYPDNFKEAVAQITGLYEEEVYIRHRDGRKLVLSAHAIVMRDEDGNVIGVSGSSRDITARKQFEDLLKEERNLLRTLIDNIPDRIYAMDRDGRKTLANAADWKACGGKAMEDVIGKTDYETYPPGLAEEFWQLDKAVLESGEPVINYEEPGLDADGNLVSILTTKIPLRNSGGKVTGLVGIGRDITERKQVEARMNDLLAFNEKILNHTPVGILTYKTTGQCIYANEKAAAILGATVAQLIAQNFRTLESWKVSGLYDVVERAIRTKSAVAEDIHHFSSFGKKVWITIHCVTFKSKGDEHVLLSISDITERQHAEEALRQSQDRYRTLVEAQTDLIVRWKPDGQRTYANEAYCRYFGLTPEEAISGGFVPLIYEKDRQAVEEKIQRLVSGATEVETEIHRVVRRDGSIGWQEWTDQAIRDSHGNLIELQAVGRDVTARKQAEVERQALLEITQGLANTADLQELLKLIHRSIAQVIYAKNFFVVMYQPDTGLFEEIYSVDQYDVPEPPSRLENSITSYVFRSGEPLLLTQILFDELVKQGEMQLVGTNSASWLGVPLKTSGRTIGVMAVQDYEIDNRYSERDKQFLASIAAQVALVIERKQADMELKQTNDDLALLNTINQAVVKGENLDSVIELLSQELKRIFSAVGSTVCILSPDKQSLTMQQYSFSSEIERRLEKLLGFAIPKIEIPVKEGGYFHTAMISRKSAITAGSQEIQRWLMEFVETKFLPSLMKPIVRKLIPQIYRLLTIKSIIVVPLISEGETIGFLDVSSPYLFKANDLKRIERIGEQLTVVIQRQRAEEALHQSEALYRRAIEVAGAVPYYQTYYQEGESIHYDFIGEGIRQITGYGPEEFNVALWDSLVEEINLIEDLAGYSLEEAIERVRKGTDATWKCEHRLRDREGKIHWVLEAAVELRDEQGISYGSIGTYQDITTRKQAEAAVRESEEHYRGIFEGVQDAILVESLDGKVLMVNEQACKMFGYGHAEFLTKTVSDLVPAGALVLTADGKDAWLSAEPRETINRRANGELFPIEISGRLQVIHGETRLLVVVRDITERKRAEEALRESEERFSSAFEYASIGMALVSPEGNWLRVNWALCELLGYSKEELSQKTFQEITHPDDLEKDLGYVRQVLAGELDSYQMEKRYLHKSGYVIWVQLSVSLVRDDGERPLYFISQIQDITERKRVEAKLQTSESRYRLATQATKDVIWEWTAEENQLIWSENAQLVFGYSYEEIGPSASWWDEHIHPQDRERVVSKLNALIATVGDELGWSEEYRLRLKDGSYAYIDDHAYLERDSSGRIIRMIGAMSNITERKQAETALVESNAKLRALFEASPDAIMLVDPHDHWSIMDCNTAGYQMNGYEREELLGQCIEILNATPGNPEERANYLARVRQQGILRYETAHRRKDGTVFPVEVSTSLITLGGREVILGIDRDISERKKAEDALRFEKERLEKIAAAVPGLIGSLRLRPDGSGCMPFASPAIQDVYGFQPADLAQDIRPFFARVHTEDLPSINASILESARTLLPWHDEFRYNHPTKGEVWIEGQSVPQREEDGSTIWHGFLYDVTERKRAEKELRDSEERFRQLADNIQEVFWMIDLETGEELYVSPAAEMVWGQSMEALMHEPNAFINSVFHEDKPLVLRNLEREKNGEKIEMEYRIVRPDGSIRWVWDRAFPIFDESGRVLRTAGISADITERKEAAERLRDSEDRYHSLFQNQIYGSALHEIITDDQGQPIDYVFIKVNPAFEKMTGLRAQELVGRRVTEVLPGIENDRFIQIYGQVALTGEPVHISEYVAPLGKHYEINAYSTGPKQFAVSFMDVTQRRQAEEQLRKLSRAVEQSASSIVITDTAGSIEYVNPKFTEITGYTFEEAMSQNPRILKSGLTSTETYQQLWESITHSGEWHGELLNKKKNGELFWEYATIAPILDEHGKTTHFLAVKEDITERKRAEESLRAEREKAQKYLEMARVMMVALDRDGIVTLINQKGCEILGYSAEEIIGNNWAKTFIPEVIRPKLQEVFRQLISGGLEPLGYYENPVLTKTGEERLIAWQNIVVRDGQGNVVGTLSSGEDITDRKRAEEQIRRRVEETSALLETSLALTNLDLNAILHTISSSAKSLFDADGCRIFLMEPNNEFLRCVLALQENFAAFSDLKVKLGEGVTGAVAASGQAEIVNEMQNDPRSIQVPGTPEQEAESIMFAPLKERDRTIGVLSIRRAGAGRPFQSEDLGLLEAFASMAASAVSNARLFEETQRQLSEQEALYENGLAISRLLKPNEIGEQVIHTFARYLPWHHVTIRLRNEASDELELVAFNLPTSDDKERTHVEQYLTTRINKVEQGLSGWVIQTGIPLRTGDVHAHPQYISIHSEIQSGLYMPLKIGERVIGVISVESEIPDAFTEQDERLLATFASQAAITFENARLYQRIERELSERKRAEEALRASETHYRELADSITDILFELDQDLHYTHWNKASEILTGTPAIEAIGKGMEEIFGDSDEQSRIRKIYEGILQDRQPRTFETMLILNGEKRSFEINAYPSTRGVSVVAKDITDRKRSETIMQKRFELMEYSAHHALNELMQKTVDEVSALTGSTIGFFHFVEADQVSLGMQTWSTNTLQLFSFPLSAGTHLPLDQAGVWAEAVRQRRPLIQNDYESLALKKGLPQGHVPILREIVIPIIRNDKVIAVMGIGDKPQEYTPYDLEIAARLADYAWDITERKQMENALAEERNQLAQRVEERTSDLSRANSNLARALRVKDEFLANMSHELRTPLNAILGLSESLGEQIAGPLNEKQQKYITTISESGHHLLSLINDILDLAKIEAGQITLDINKIDINLACQASLRMIKQLAQKKNQEVTLEIDSGLGVMWADERRLKQMIVNLLGNAVKFTPENGRIGLEVHGDQEANKITITVWDNGIGIGEEDLHRLFQPFVQLDSGLAREATGTGLGLALVAQMARLHGGSVNALSEPGKGSRFSILLPWEPALATDTASRLRTTGKFRAIKPNETNKPTILLVEDTKEVIMMIQDYLELAGYKVVTAQDGVDGIAQAKLIHPDLILMDVMMPRMDGFEATRKLRSEPDFRYTPIIALTALAMPNDRERCLAAGMDEYISKPINLKALIKIIQSCLFANEESRSR